MALSDHPEFDDQKLASYLLGNLPEEDAEQLDELSIADEEFSWRLSAVENDLVDAYARGELSPVEREQFKSHFVSSQRGQRKLEFARAWAMVVQRVAVRGAGSAASVRPEARVSLAERLRRALFLRPAGLFWGSAAAALAMLVVAGYLFVANQRLQQELNSMQGQHRRELEVERQLAQAKAANAEAQEKMSQASAHQPEMAYVLLPTPMRGAGRLTTVTVKSGTDFVVLFLMLETDDSSTYRATLKDTSTKQVIWSSAELSTQALAGKKVVPVSLPSALLKAQNYILELAGGPSGHSEVVGDYVFRAVLE